MNKITQKRIVYFDIIRVCAILMVVLFHSASHFTALLVAQTKAYMLCKSLVAVTQPAVPLFVMLSGALMLNEDKHISDKKILKSAGNLWLLLVIWSLIYAVAYYAALPAVMGNSVQLAELRYTAIYGNYHLWYLFMIIGLYLLTPIMRLFVKRENAKYILWYIVAATAVQFVLCAVPAVEEYMAEFRWGFASRYAVYYFAGWYVTQAEIKSQTKKLIYTAGLISLAAMLISVNVPALYKPEIYNLISNESITVLLVSVAFFVAVKEKCAVVKSEKAKEIVKKLSALSFGVYLVHDGVLTVVRQFTDVIANALVETVANFVLCTVISFAAVAIMSKIPFVKKLIRG